MGAQPTVNVNSILGIGGGAPAAATTSGPPTPNATSVAENNPSAWYYSPEYMVASPQETPGAFGMQGTDVTPTQVAPTANIFTGDAAGPQQALSNNQIIANLADRLGVKAKKGVSLEEQVAKKVSQMSGTQGLVAETATGYEFAAPLSAVAQRLGVAATQIPKNPQYQQAGQVAASIAHNSTPQEIQQLQDQMYQAGFYDDAVYTDKSVVETPGHITQWTQSAIGNMLSALQAYNSANPNSPMTWQQFLQSAQSNPNMQGPIGAAKTSTPPVYATSAQLTSTLQSAFEKELGRMPSAQDIQAFTSWYDQQQANKAGAANSVAGGVGSGGTQPPTLGAGAEQQAQAQAQGSGYVDFNTGVPMIPGVPTASEAAVPFAQSADQTQYLSHQIANSYALFLNSIIGRTSEKALPGYNPDITTASSSV